MTWQVVRAKHIVAPYDMATLEFVGSEMITDTSHGTPPATPNGAAVTAYSGDDGLFNGNFFIGANTNEFLDHINYTAKFYFHLRYRGIAHPSTEAPALGYDVTMQSGSFLYYLEYPPGTWYRTSTYDLYFGTFKPTNPAFGKSYPNFGYTGLQTWGIHNLDTHSFDHGWYMEFATINDYWMCFSVAYTYNYAAAWFHMNNFWYEHHWIFPRERTNLIVFP